MLIRSAHIQDIFSIVFSCIVLSTLFNDEACAQWQPINVSGIGPDQNLMMAVKEFTQDQTGYIYFGGTQGLARWDGTQIKIFSSIEGDSTSISSGEVNSLATDQENKIWISMRYDGVNRFDPVTEKFKRYKIPDLEIKYEHSCSGLLIDERDDVWFGGRQIHLYKLDRTADTLMSYKPAWLEKNIGKRYSINKIIQDNRDPDIFWLSVTDFITEDNRYNLHLTYAVISFNRRTKKFTQHPNLGRISKQMANGEFLATHHLNRIYQWNSESMDLTIHPFKAQPNRDFMARDIIRYNQSFWVTTAQNILSYNPDWTYEVIYTSNEDTPYFQRLFEDKDKNMWVSSNQGVKVYDPKVNMIDHFSLSQFDDFDRIYPGRIVYDKKANQILLAHSKEDGRNRLYRIPLDRNRAADFIDYGSDIWGMARFEDDIVVSSRNGVHIIESTRDGEMRKETLIDQPLSWHWNLRNGPGGRIALTGASNFSWFDEGSDTLRHVLTANLPGVLDKEKEKGLYGSSFISANEVLVFAHAMYWIDLKTSRTGKFRFDDTFNPENLEIFDARVDLNGYYWVAGKNYLGKFSREGDELKLEKSFTTIDGLAQTQVTELHVDHQNRIWCFTPVGINCIDNQNDEIRYFGIKDGLPQVFIDPRKIISLPDQRIATVNKNGLILFHPDALWESKSTDKTKVVIQQIRINGEKYGSHTSAHYSEGISLPFTNNVIDITFQGLHFPFAGDLNYSYRLTGLNDIWIDLEKNRLVTLSGLQPNDYVFEVKTGSPHSTSAITSIPIKILTPFYRTTWFIILAIAVALIAFYLIYQYRIRKIQKEAQAKIEVDRKIAELELSALRAQMNPHFMFNSLNSIKNFILRSEPKIAAEYLSNFAHLIRIILQNSREKTISLEEELEALELYIELEQLRFDDDFEYVCNIDPNIRMENIQIPPMILQPYIENAIWHGLMHLKENRRLTLSFIKTSEKGIVCEIDDNGIGRKKANEIKDRSMQRYKSMGMGITKDRVDIMNKMSAMGITIDLEDKWHEDGKSAGTKVIVHIPTVPMDE